MATSESDLGRTLDVIAKKVPALRDAGVTSVRVSPNGDVAFFISPHAPLVGVAAVQTEKDAEREFDGLINGRLTPLDDPTTFGRTDGRVPGLRPFEDDGKPKR